jgi:hypothetical protein
MNYVKILSEGLTTKVGDISTQFRFQLLNEYRSPVDLSSHTVTIQIATDSTALIQRVLTPTDAVNGVVTFSFEADDSIGYGQRDIEFIVEGSVNEREVYPSDGYLRMNIQPNLLDRDGSEEIRVSLLDVQMKASEAAEYANEQGDYAKAAGDSAISEWENPVNTFDDLATVYPSPTLGDTAQTLDNGHIYRFNGTEWKYIQGYGATAIADINAKLEESEQQTQTLQHGLNVLSSDQASPLKVEFYGVTRANLIPNFNSNLWSISGNVVNDYTVSRTAAAESENLANIRVKISSDKFYLFKLETNARYDILGFLNGTHIDNIYLNYTNEYVRLNPSGYDEFYIRIESKSAGDFEASKIRLYEISQATYDKIGDLSLIGKDQEYVEKAFPYVSGVQSVVNPVIRVAGANLLPPFYEWDLHDNATVISPYELRLDATAIAQQSPSPVVKLVPNNQYSLSLNADSGIRLRIRFYNEQGAEVGSAIDYDDGTAGTFTAPIGTSYAIFNFYNLVATGTFTFSQPMLNLGSEPRPFVPKNDSYLYAYKVNEETGENEPLILAGNDDKKDISYYNEGNSRWEVKRWFETDVVLDGSLSWSLDGNGSGFKKLRTPFSELPSTPLGTDIFTDDANNHGQGVKFDGSILSQFKSSFSGGDQLLIHGTHSIVVVSVSDTDSGWTDAMSPSTDLIKSYFHGWFYRGDGTTHSWRPIGDTDDTRLTTTLPTSPSPTMLDGTIQPYKLTYQLAEPIVEEVRVEGDLSIQGSAQISVGEGVIVREEVEPKKSGTVEEWYINEKGIYSSEDSPLKNRVKKFIDVHKNGEVDNSWIFYTNSNNQNGENLAKTTDYDPNATYTVTYEILDKHDFTTNLNEVVAYYNSSIKSSIQGVVSKQTRIATDVSVLGGTVYDMLLRLKKLEQEGAV